MESLGLIFEIMTRMTNCIFEMKKAFMEEKTEWAEEKHKMKEDYQRLASRVYDLEVEVKHLGTENCELSKRLVTSEIKMTLLTNGDLLEKFGELQWNERPPTFQKELLGKLEWNDDLMKFMMELRENSGIPPVAF